MKMKHCLLCLKNWRNFDLIADGQVLHHISKSKHRVHFLRKGFDSSCLFLSVNYQVCDPQYKEFPSNTYVTIDYLKHL